MVGTRKFFEVPWTHIIREKQRFSGNKSYVLCESLLFVRVADRGDQRENTWVLRSSLSPLDPRKLEFFGTSIVFSLKKSFVCSSNRMSRSNKEHVSFFKFSPSNAPTQRKAELIGKQIVFPLKNSSARSSWGRSRFQRKHLSSLKYSEPNLSEKSRVLQKINHIFSEEVFCSFE